jgi:hypothetical protein
MKQGFVMVCEGFQVRFEKRENGATMEVQIDHEKLVERARWDDKFALLRDRVSMAQIHQLAEWLLDR